MRVPASWLAEFVDLPDAVTAEHLHAALVRVGLEEEDVHRFDVTGPVVVGQVLSFTPEPQSNGKTINWCQVDVGEAEPRGIVCGAHNFVVGDKVVVTLPGAVLPGPFPIAARKTYGHTSDGMIASARELGLGDEHDGILRLAALGLDPVVGSDAIALLGLDDFAVEVNVTPDRGYAFSIRGIAREYSNSTGAAFRDPALRSSTPGSFAQTFPVLIADTTPIRGNPGVTVFETRTVRNVDAAKPTPPWMVSRLTLAGIRSISLVVDITNYVMLEFGQPTHGYDLDKLSGGITVRRANPGEKIVTLDARERALSTEDLVIADESGAIGIAGVMGGASTEITSTTKNVLVEAANFDPISIARSARRHKLPSEASKRFERGVDLAAAPVAVDRVVQLLLELAGGTPDSLGSSWSAASAPASIDLPGGYVEKLIGVAYADDEVQGALRAIGATLEPIERGLRVSPPTWRPDLIDKPTLVEEVARIVGYDRIPSVLPVAPPGRGLTREQRLRRAASQALAFGGITEVLAYPFLSAKQHALFSGELPAVKLANPLDAEVPFLRRTLIPGLLDIARRNIARGLTDLALFEVGTVFLPEPGRAFGISEVPPSAARPSDAVLAEMNDRIPPQAWHAGALFLGDSIAKQPGVAPVAAGLADALAAAHQLAASFGLTVTVVSGSHPALHPGRTAEIFVGETLVGMAGELLPSVSADLDLPRVVAVLSVDLDVLITLAPEEVVPTPIATFPVATQDLSLVVAVEVPAASVLAAVIEGSGQLLEDASLVDDYRGAGVPRGSKSLTFALRFRAPDRTLTAGEASDAKLAGVALAASRFGAALRE